MTSNSNSDLFQKDRRTGDRSGKNDRRRFQRPNKRLKIRGLVAALILTAILALVCYGLNP